MTAKNSDDGGRDDFLGYTAIKKPALIGVCLCAPRFPKIITMAPHKSSTGQGQNNHICPKWKQGRSGFSLKIMSQETNGRKGVRVMRQVAWLLSGF